MNPEVDWFFNKASKWQEEYAALRALVLDCALTEELKWGCPCYTIDGANIVLLHGFKDYCALLFMKGSLMKDPEALLIQQTENVQDRRQLRFKSLADIDLREETIKQYILQAITIERSGLKVEHKKTEAYKVPDEFQQVLNSMPDLQTAFQALTPGRQRGYLLYFAAPKQAKTREARIEKYVQKILDGKGLED